MDTHHADEKPVIRQKFQSCRLDVRLELVQFDTVPVVDEDIFVLGYRKMRMILQEPRSWVTVYSTSRAQQCSRYVPTCLPQL